MFAYEDFDSFDSYYDLEEEDIQDWWHENCFPEEDYLDKEEDDCWYDYWEEEEDYHLDYSAEVISMVCGVKQTAKGSCKCSMCRYARNSARNKAILRTCNKSFRRKAKMLISQGIYEVNLAPRHPKYLS